MPVFRIIALLICLLPLAAPLHADTMADRLPRDTVMLISAPDLSRSWEQFKKSSLHDIWQEPSVKALVEKLEKLFEKEAGKADGLKKMREEFKNKVGIELDDLYKILFKGEFSLALIDFEIKEEGPPTFDVLLTLDIDKEGDSFEKLLRFAVDMAIKEGGLKKETLKIGEDKVQILSTPDAPFKLHLATKNGRFFLATDVKTIKIALTSGRSDGEKLSSNPQYIAARKGIDAKQEIAHFYVNLEAIWKRTDKQLPPEAKSMMEKLGVFGIKALSAGTQFDGKAIRDHFYLAMPGARVGIQQLFTYPKTDLKGLKYAPADVGSFSVAGISWNKIYTEALRVFKTIDEQEFKNFEVEKKRIEEQLGMKIDDIIASLGTQVTSFTRKPSGDASKKTKPADFFSDLFRATYIIGLKDEKTAEAGIKALMKMMELKDRTEEHHGWTIHLIDLPQEADAPFKNAGWAIKDGNLFLGMPGSNLKQLAKEQASGSTGLAASEVFKAEMARYPEGFSSFSYVDLAAYLRAIYASATPFIKETLEKSKSPIQFKDLPDIEVIAKHLTPMTGANYSDADGMRVVYRSPMGGMSSMFIIGAGAAIAIPAFSSAQDTAKQAACLKKLKEIGKASALFKADTGKYPEGLPELVNGEKKYLEGEPFKCPSDQFPQREGKVETSFVFIYSNKLGDKDGTKTILCYDKSPQHNGNTRNVLFLDGTVQNMSDFEFRELFKVQKARLKKQGIQVFIGWGKLK